MNLTKCLSYSKLNKIKNKIIKLKNILKYKQKQ